MAAFALSDALAKQLAASFPPFALAWFRYLGLLLIVLPLALRQPALCRAAHPWLQLLRAAAMAGSAVFFLYALRSIPQAEATAMVFASPLCVLILARVLLHERIGAKRLMPVLAGFVGVLVVVRPGSFHFEGAELYPLLSSLSWATAVVLTRKLSASDDSRTTMLYSAGFGVLGLSLLLPGVDWTPARAAWPLIVAMALCWCAAQWGVVAAYRLAAPSVIAPFSYSQLLWAALLGLGMTGHWPDALSLAGIGLIVMSGLYAAWTARSRI